MGKKFILTETDKNEIRKMYGLIKEQYSDGMIPAKGYQIIEDIEDNMGRAQKIDGKWKPSPTPHKGDELEQVIKSYINQYLTDQQWFRIDPLFRTQIYSFMFQAGSSPGKEYRWIAGLAQAIDPSLDRGKIISDENYRKNAANVVIQKINDGTINDYYGDYISKINEQYASLKPNTGSKPEQIEQFQKNYEIAWKNRPAIVEQMWNGATISQMINKYFGTQPYQQKTIQPEKKDSKKEELVNFGISAKNIPELNEKFRKLDQRIETEGKFKVHKIDIYQYENEIDVKLTIEYGEEGYDKYRLLFTPQPPNPGEQSSVDRVLETNPTAKILFQGEKTLKGKTGQDEKYKYYLVGL